MKRKATSQNISDQEPASSTQIGQERQSEEQRSTAWKEEEEGRNGI